MSRISILGCGWLGLVLGKTLVAGGHTVVGSTTSKDKLAELESAGIHPVLLRDWGGLSGIIQLLSSHLPSMSS